MKRPYARALGVLLAAGLLIPAVPALAGPRVPKASVTWTSGTALPFAATRWDGEYVTNLNRVYFLGFRAADNTTDGSIWYYDVATSTYVDTGRDMPVPVSNYQISMLRDARGIGLYIFGGRDANGLIVTTVQAYYPALNKAFTINTDPWPGTTPSACVSLPGMGVATLSNKAYVMGGASFSSSIPPCVDDNSAQTWIFDPAAAPGTKWSPGPNLNVARGYITAAVLAGRVYAIGGDTNVAGTLFATATVESWKPPSGGWNDAAVADLPVPCDESQAFPFTSGPLAKGIVLATCGQWPNDLPDTYFYSTVGNTWSDIGAVLETRRNEAGALIRVGTGLQMFILGGYAADGATALASTELGAGGPSSGRPGSSLRPDPGTRPSTS